MDQDEDPHRVVGDRIDQAAAAVGVRSRVPGTSRMAAKGKVAEPLVERDRPDSPRSRDGPPPPAASSGPLPCRDGGAVGLYRSIVAPGAGVAGDAGGRWRGAERLRGTALLTRVASGEVCQVTQLLRNPARMRIWPGNARSHDHLTQAGCRELTL